MSLGLGSRVGDLIRVPSQHINPSGEDVVLELSGAVEMSVDTMDTRFVFGPLTLNPKPKTLNPKPQALNYRPERFVFGPSRVRI